VIEDLHFHNAIAEAAHNVLFAAMFESLSRLMLETRRELVLTKRDLSNSFYDYQLVFRQVVGRNKAGAREAMFDHLDRAYHIWEATQRVKQAPVGEGNR
jgi:DNA-binding FadR family transcriptional regulator